MRSTPSLQSAAIPCPSRSDRGLSLRPFDAPLPDEDLEGATRARTDREDRLHLQGERDFGVAILELGRSYRR
jgi:hypothetical protein